MSVQISEKQGSIVLGKAGELFKFNAAAAIGGSDYDVAADGKRFVVREQAGKAKASLGVIVNWPALLKKH